MKEFFNMKYKLRKFEKRSDDSSDSDDDYFSGKNSKKDGSKS